MSISSLCSKDLPANADTSPESKPAVSTMKEITAGLKQAYAHILGGLHNKYEEWAANERVKDQLIANREAHSRLWN